MKQVITFVLMGAVLAALLFGAGMPKAHATALLLGGLVGCVIVMLFMGGKGHETGK